jgi:hypothetical protein
MPLMSSLKFAGYDGAYPGEAHSLSHKYSTRLESLARDKHSSLLRTFVNYGRKKFYIIGPCIVRYHMCLVMHLEDLGLYT